MQVEKLDGSGERRILIGMIISKAVLSRIAPRWEKDGLFSSRWANIIGGWCVEYRRRYEKAPGKQIVGLFQSWASDPVNGRDKDTITLVERLLESLSEEWDSLKKEINPDYLVDFAGEYFNKVRLLKLAEGIQGDIDSGHADKAQKRLNKFSHLELGGTARVDVLNDLAAIERALEVDAEPPLIQFEGAASEFFRKAFKRSKFVALLAPTKTGKTTWLTDFAYRAVKQDLRVAFFAIGDEEEEDMMIRFAQRSLRRPIEAKSILWPMSIDHDVGELVPRITHEEIDYGDPVTAKDIRRAFSRLAKSGASKDRLGLSCHPSLSLSVDGIEDILDGWERDSWGSPDVCIIDYADNLAAAAGYAQSEDRINITWQKLRGLSQSRSMLVITATQSDAQGYNAQTLSKSNFSNDRRKLDHVTGMIGINVTEAEKAVGASRLNWLALRKGKFLESECLHVAGCLDAANPLILSTF